MFCLKRHRSRPFKKKLRLCWVYLTKELNELLFSESYYYIVVVDFNANKVNSF